MLERIKKAILKIGFVAALVGICVGAALSILLIAAYEASHLDILPALGDVGEYFSGLLTPILTFLSLIGILFTIYLQRSELILSRHEFSRSATALETQSNNYIRQSFDSSFFNMLQLHNTIVNSIDLRNTKGIETRGRDCFTVFYNRLSSDYKSRGYNSDPLNLEKIQISYDAFWTQHQVELGHYYRYLYNVVRFVDQNSQLNAYHMNLLRAQLADQELLLLFYNCLSSNGHNFKTYVEKYALFDNLPKSLLMNPQHSTLFDAAAFG